MFIGFVQLGTQSSREGDMVEADSVNWSLESH